MTITEVSKQMIRAHFTTTAASLRTGMTSSLHRLWCSSERDLCVGRAFAFGGIMSQAGLQELTRFFQSMLDNHHLSLDSSSTLSGGTRS